MTVNRIAAGAGVCCAVLFASACGVGAPATVGASGTSTTATPGGAGGDAAGGARGFRFPGATGLLAQIDGKTLQVQGTDTQTAVTYSAKTTFTDTVVAKLSDVAVGACVQARSARPTSGTGGAAPTADAGPIAAASVEISPAVNGRCTVGGARMPGAGAQGGNGGPTPPAGMPTSGRTRGPGAGGGFFGIGAFGKVTAVNGAGFTVESSRPVNGTATAPAPTTQAVQTSAATTYTRTEAAKANALVVGLCVTALGKADSTGSIAATSIALRRAVNGSCSSGFGGGPPSGMQTPAGGGSGA
jgi:hypothetical protein